MQAKLDEVVWLNEQETVTLSELVEASGLTLAELQELVECGVLAPVESKGVEAIFYARCVTTAKTAGRLRRDFELDTHALALALTLLERVQELEARIRELGARTPGGMRGN
ncbi:MAG: hypothetical protein KGL13_06560 [Gammaproteobacteria bacterium]|nr:hypothetical protein [Gammaproteobacteria bacterium]MDE2346111.1 hypothetical protein [Gammaproteobacteria bacterium]